MRIRDPIHGTIHAGPEETRVIDSRFFQRLRHVKQLGFGELAFPGATHTRHAHSLGAMHVAGRLFDAVARPLPEPTRARFRAAVRLAVLCHDLGHMPLSHASEAVAPERAKLMLPSWLGTEGGRASHEDYTARILLGSELTPVLASALTPWSLSPEHLVSLITGEAPPSGSPFVEAGVDWAPLLRAIVSGELDADRMDYLQRDSFFTGVNYGRYDFEWIVGNLSAAEQGGSMYLALSRVAAFEFDDFLLSRYHMFLSVYYHHTSVSFDHMLRRYYDEAPGELEIPADPEGFLRCDDVALHARLRTSDNRWAKRLVDRKGFKRVAEFTERDEGYDLAELDRALSAAGLEHFSVESRGVLSRYFEEGSAPSLLILDPSSGRLTDVAKYTPLYQRFAGAVRLSRVYVRPDQVEAARPIIARLTGVAP